MSKFVAGRVGLPTVLVSERAEYAKNERCGFEAERAPEQAVNGAAGHPQRPRFDAECLVAAHRGKHRALSVLARFGPPVKRRRPPSVDPEQAWAAYNGIHDLADHQLLCTASSARNARARFRLSHSTPLSSRHVLDGPTAQNVLRPPESVHAIEPPPAPTVTRSMAGVAIGMPYSSSNSCT